MAFNPFNAITSLRDRAGDVEPMQAERQSVFDLKAKALDNAHKLATSENRDCSFRDYIVAAAELAPKAREQGLQWNAAVIADLSKQKLTNMTINETDFNPTEETKLHIQASLQKDLESGITNQRDMYDLDGNGQIDVSEVNDFYADLNRNLKFDHAFFDGVTFHPASTVHICDNAVGAHFVNITLDHIGADDTMTIGSGAGLSSNNRGERYHNVTLTNVQDGTFCVNSYAVLDNLTIEGQSRCTVVMKHGAQINCLSAQEGDTVRLQMESGATLARCDFKDATISPDSCFNGGVIRDGKFTNVTQRDLDCRNSRISGCEFDSCDLTGTDFTGASIANCSFNNMSMSEVYDACKGAHYVHGVTVNGRSCNLQEMRVLASAEQIGKNLAPAMAEIAPAAEPKTVAELGAGLGTGGEHTSLDNQQTAGAQGPQNADERLAVALARADKVNAGGIMRS
jgi:uncharacterized protein YjbI with pentapeptide repeats